MPLRGGGTAGRYNVSGIPDVTGGWASLSYEGQGTYGAFSHEDTVNSSSAPGGQVIKVRTFAFAASRSSAQYGAQSTVMPASADMPIGLYLGRPAEI